MVYLVTLCSTQALMHCACVHNNCQNSYRSRTWSEAQLCCYFMLLAVTRDTASYSDTVKLYHYVCITTTNIAYEAWSSVRVADSKPLLTHRGSHRSHCASVYATAWMFNSLMHWRQQVYTYHDHQHSLELLCCKHSKSEAWLFKQCYSYSDAIVVQ